MLCLMELLAFTFAFKAPPTSKMSQNIKQNFGASVRLDCEPSTDRNIFNQNIFELKDKLLWWDPALGWKESSRIFAVGYRPVFYDFIP